MSRVSWVAVIAALGLASACASPSYVRSAYYGNLATLKTDVGAAVRSGSMDRDGVLELARAVARREVRSASGAVAVERIHDARPCAGAVELELRARAESSDDTGAEALLVLLDAGKVAKDDMLARYSRAERGAFRALSARAAVAPSAAELRRSFYADPDERVRRGALRAALEAQDPRDLALLLEAARLDPSPGNRAAAIRAVGALGGAEALLGLGDLWAGAEEPARLALVEAWAMPRMRAVGGTDRLQRLAESGQGLTAVSAAAALARADGDADRIGRAVLGRFIAEGTTDQRMLAAQLAPLSDPEIVKALDRAGGSDDPQVAIVALARLLEVPSRAPGAKRGLLAAAQKTDGASRQARAALAAALDPKVIPLLTQDLSADAAARERAALGLFRLGLPSRMATVLADTDPGVRMSVACAVAAESG